MKGSHTKEVTEVSGKQRGNTVYFGGRRQVSFIGQDRLTLQQSVSDGEWS